MSPTVLRQSAVALIVLSIIGASWPRGAAYPAFVAAALADDDGGHDGGDDGDDEDRKDRKDRSESKKSGSRATGLARVLDDLNASRVTPPEDRGRDSRREKIAILGVRRAEATQPTARGFRVLFQTPVALLEGPMIARLSLPPGVDLLEGVQMAREVAPNAVIDLNHLYRPLAGGCESGRCYGATLVGRQGDAATRPVRAPIGMIDTGADANHPSLAARGLLRPISTTRGAAALISTMAPPSRACWWGRAT